jgi:hypothetical protein
LGAALSLAKSFAIRSGAVVGGASFEAASKAETVLEINIPEEGQSDFLLLGAILESLLELIRKLKEEEHAAYKARVRKAKKQFAKLN